MRLSHLQNKLITAARKNTPGEQVPYAFEKRIMARLAAHSPMNAWALWGQSLWRAAISCVAITALCGLWCVVSAPSAKTSDTFSQDFESAVFASMDQHVEDGW
jgi:hypothetical protein